jgi:hypothetical protein
LKGGSGMVDLVSVSSTMYLRLIPSGNISHTLIAESWTILALWKFLPSRHFLAKRSTFIEKMPPGHWQKANLR